MKTMPIHCIDVHYFLLELNHALVDQRQHGGRQQREKGKKLDGRTGVRYKSQRLIELVGGIVLRPYVPHGTKKIGNR